MSDSKPVAGYYRVSVARDGMKAPELYQSEIDRYCQFKRLRLQKTFSDIDHSAFRGARTRPALEDLKARRKEFSAVVVPKLSRFGRSVKDLISLFELFDSDDIPLVFLDMDLDTPGPVAAPHHGRVRGVRVRRQVRLRTRDAAPHGA